MGARTVQRQVCPHRSERTPPNDKNPRSRSLFDQDFECSVLEIEDAAEIGCHDLRLCLADDEAHLLSDVLGVEEENPPLQP